MSFVDEIEKLKLPKIISKIPLKLHDDYKWIEEKINEWMIKESFSAKHILENQWKWICQVYSNAISKERLLLNTKLQAVLFLIDDTADVFAENNNYKDLEMYYNGLVQEFMDYNRINENSSYEAKLFREIWIEMLPDLSENLSNRIVNTICDFMKMMKHIQLNYRKEGKFIGLETYMSYRVVDVCELQSLLLIEYSLGIEFNDEIRCHKDYKELIGLCIKRSILVNDILALKVELPRCEIMNYCIAYLYDKQCSLQEAVDNAFIYLTEIDMKYKACIDRCLKYNESLYKEFVTSCLGLSDGILWWHLETTRYGLAKKSLSTSDRNELINSKLVEVENKIKRKHSPIIDIPVSEVIGGQNANLYLFYDE